MVARRERRRAVFELRAQKTGRCREATLAAETRTNFTCSSHNRVFAFCSSLINRTAEGTGDSAQASQECDTTSRTRSGRKAKDKPEATAHLVDLKSNVKPPPSLCQLVQNQKRSSCAVYFLQWRSPIGVGSDGWSQWHAMGTQECAQPVDRNASLERPRQQS